MCTSDGRHKKWNETQYNDKQKISFNAQTGRFLVTGFWQTIFFVFSATRVHINTQHKQTKNKVNKQTNTMRTNWLAILIVLMMLDIRNVCVILGHVCDRTYGQSNVREILQWTGFTVQHRNGLTFVLESRSIRLIVYISSSIQLCCNTEYIRMFSVTLSLMVDDMSGPWTTPLFVSIAT